MSALHDKVFLNFQFVAGQFDLEFYDTRAAGMGVNLRDMLFRLDLQRCTDHMHEETAEHECVRCTEAARNVPINAITANVGAAIVDMNSEERWINYPRIQKVLSNRGIFTGRDFVQYSTVIVLKGPYKACIGEYIGTANGKAEVRLQARREGPSVWIEPQYLYNL